MKRISLITFMLFALVSVTWGTTWFAMRVAVETIPPIFATGMRFMLASPVLIAIAWLTNTPLLFPSGQRLFQVAVCLFYFSVPFTLMIYGEIYVSPGLASIIFANMPVAVLIMSLIFLKEKTNLMQICGLSMAVISLAGILRHETGSTAGSHWQGIVALVLAVLIHAVMYVQCKKRGCQVSVLTFNALPCLFAGLILLAVGIITEHPNVLHFAISSVVATVYLGAFAGVMGILAYFALQQRANAFLSSVVFLIFPLIAVSLDDAISGQTLTKYSAILLVPLLTGVLLIFIPTLNIRAVDKENG